MQKVTKALLDKKSSLLAKILFVCYTIFLVFATLVPTSIMSSGKKSWLSNIQFENGDKVVHAALFFIFSFLLYYSGWSKNKYSWLIIPFLTGVAIEFLQEYLGWGRTLDIWDVVGNTIGILLAFRVIFIIDQQTNSFKK